MTSRTNNRSNRRARSTHESFLAYRNMRWFWLALLLSSISLLLYIWHDPVDPPNGGTTLGYILGTIGAGLIVWLTLLGIRKRRYHSKLGTVKGWLSAHVYLGLSLLFIGTLHAGFQFGWNVHTLAYSLMCIVILSGVVGVIIYVRYPTIVAGNRDARTRQALLNEVTELDQQILNAATACDTEIAHAVDDAVQHTKLGGSALKQLRGADQSTVLLNNKRQPNEGQSTLINWLAERCSQTNIHHHTEAQTTGHLTTGHLNGELHNEQHSIAQIQTLIDIVSAKRHITERICTDMRLHAWLKIWLFIHIPVSVSLLAALAAHIVSVFIYW